MKKIVVFSLVTLFAVFAALGAVAQTGVKKKRPLPPDYGKVVIANFSWKAHLAGVEFDHWLHRSKFTCRLCHVDIGFAMKKEGTGIEAADNMKGYYCGSCHREGGIAFPSCSRKFVKAADMKQCERCHSQGKSVKRKYDFSEYTSKFPKARYGNGIDWQKAEEEGLIKLTDYLEGSSIDNRGRMAIQQDFVLSSKVQGMPDIIFSHRKHTVWNGCQVCHPEIFIGVKTGATKYSMVEIFEGKFCGVCHGTVAFPLMDCLRCHTKSV